MRLVDVVLEIIEIVKVIVAVVKIALGVLRAIKVVSVLVEFAAGVGGQKCDLLPFLIEEEIVERPEFTDAKHIRVGFGDVGVDGALLQFDETVQSSPEIIAETDFSRIDIVEEPGVDGVADDVSVGFMSELIWAKVAKVIVRVRGIERGDEVA